MAAAKKERRPVRLLAVYDLASLQPADTALSLALLTQALDPATPLTAVLGLGASAAACGLR